MKSASITRRRFLETAGAFGVGVIGLPTVIPRSALGAPGRPSANNQFVIGLIGTGGMGGTHLANLSMILGRKLVWDGDKQMVVGDAQANRMLSKQQRYPYCL